MNEKKLISVIIPIHNGEAYIDHCLQSVRSSSYQNLEIILVENGSTDCSLEMCQRRMDQIYALQKSLNYFESNTYPYECALLCLLQNADFRLRRASVRAKMMLEHYCPLLFRMMYQLKCRLRGMAA